MALYDIPVSSVLSELGSFPQNFNTGVEFKQGVNEYDIQIINEKPSEQKERNLNELKQLNVRSINGAQFELQNISSFQFTEGMPVIKRVNQSKQLEIEYQFINEVQDDKDLLSASRLKIEEILRNIALPSGITTEIIHEKQDLSDFWFLILSAIILIYMILASVFESLSKPVVILMAIPLAATGSLIALILTGNSLLNANTLTGFVILIGIVVNNAIILLDYSNILRQQGYNQSR
jgi:multidrug efflux pump subunit AcrB